MKNVYAHTDPGSDYPGFVSVKEAGAGLSVMVRSPRCEDGSCGSVAALTLAPAEVDRLGDALQKWRKARKRSGTIGAHPSPRLGSVVADTP